MLADNLKKKIEEIIHIDNWDDECDFCGIPSFIHVGAEQKKKCHQTKCYSFDLHLNEQDIRGLQAVNRFNYNQDIVILMGTQPYICIHEYFFLPIYFLNKNAC